jgi:hypothetical protein
VGKYVGETVDSLIDGAAAVFAGKSPFAGGRSKVGFLMLFASWNESKIVLLTVIFFLVQEP